MSKIVFRTVDGTEPFGFPPIRLSPFATTNPHMVGHVGCKMGYVNSDYHMWWRGCLDIEGSTAAQEVGIYIHHFNPEEGDSSAWLANSSWTGDPDSLLFNILSGYAHRQFEYDLGDFFHGDRMEISPVPLLGLPLDPPEGYSIGPTLMEVTYRGRDPLGIVDCSAGGMVRDLYLLHWVLYPSETEAQLFHFLCGSPMPCETLASNLDPLLGPFLPPDVSISDLCQQVPDSPLSDPGVPPVPGVSI